MKPKSLFNGAAKLALLLGALSVQVFTSQIDASAAPLAIPNVPLTATINAKPMTMLIAGRDHRLFYEAYNDASDVDGDGALDIRFKPTITYYGLFDSTVCYRYVDSGGQSDEQFEPYAAADASGRCLGTGDGQWSGNWLNYVTTSRIDALRKVLYGGHREVDIDGKTILRRAYIPQDAHSWGKEYRNVATDGYDIRDFTPLGLPSGSGVRRHFFGSLTETTGRDCTTLSDCSNRRPLLRIRPNVENRRIWEWASKERPVLHDGLSVGSFTSDNPESNYTVRVLVCTASFNTDCKRYPNGNIKPIGLLHEYGENDAMLFGLITGSYDRHMTGGRLRKVVASFGDEIVADSGIFRTGSSAPIVTSFNNLRIRGYNQSSNTGEYAFSNPYAASALAPTEGQFVDWGNPIGEMMYEGLRYFAGANAARNGFDSSGERTIDGQVGLSSASWDDPYSSTSTARAQYCARPNFLIVSNINPSFDSNSMPGSTFNTGFSESLGNLSGLNVTTVANAITGIEDRAITSAITGRSFFIGQSGTGASDNAPTPKTVAGLGTVRGLAPDETSKQGSFYSAAVAYWSKTNNIRRDLTTTHSAANVNIDSYVVALSSPLPTIEVTINGRKVSLVPFAKSVSGSGISNAKTAYQPTNQIVDYYVEELTLPTNAATGEGYKAVFQINFEDVEQGGDHDMDAIARYTIEVVSGQLRVTVVPTYQAGGIQQHMGFVISGVTDAGGTVRDGVYLVARDENVSPRYYLNVPPGQWAGHCNYDNTSDMPAACATLPTIGEAAHTYVFRPNTSGNSAQLLKDPLWYVAKYGGYVKEDDENSSGVGPTRQSEWDALPVNSNGTVGDGVPDNYFLVQNPLNLKASLRRALENIANNSASGGNIIANSTRLEEESYVFQATFNNSRWSGDLLAYRASSSGVSQTADWNAAAELPKNSNAARRIFYWSDASGANKGKEFLWGNLSNAEKTNYFGADATLGQRMLNYIRGADTYEYSRGGTFRDRSATTVLGDVAHSSPAYSKDSSVVFVGSNGGMLHAFSTLPLSSTNSVRPGTELFAYVPSAVLPRLRNLAAVGYNVNHEYFVDGDVAVSTQVGSPARNYLVATLGRGGKGLFGLDVTNPASFSANDVKWEYFSTSDADLGRILGRPAIAKAANGTDVVLVGNGYNSTNESAALYVFNLTTGALIRKLVVPTTALVVGGGNGLAMPGVFDANNDDRIDVAYAGDMYGQVWRFDLSGTDPATWSVSNSGAPIFVARDGLGNIQPITAPMTVAINSVSVDPNFNKRFVFFGTGSYFQTTDPANTRKQTLYSIVDDPATPHTNRSQLYERTLSSQIVFEGLRDPSKEESETNPKITRVVRKLSAQTAAGDMNGKLGCFVDMPEAGERIVTRANLFRLAEPTLIASSIIPETVDQCVPGGRGYVNAVNPFTCARLSKPFFDLNDSGSFADDALSDGSYASSVETGGGLPGEAIIIGNRLVVGLSGPPPFHIRINTGATPLKGRLSWREIVRD